MVMVSDAKRIAMNTLLSYVVSLVSLGLVLFSSRWALAELGEVDFGLYSLIGSVLTIVVFLNAVLSRGDARFFAVGIGEGDGDKLSRVFNSSFSIHIVMPVIIFVLFFFVVEYLIIHYFVIPPDRIATTQWVFRITLLASFVSMIAVPYSTLLIANQKIILYSLISLLQTFNIFIGSYLLKYYDGDKLLVFTLIVASAHVLSNILQIVVSRCKYRYSKIHLKYFFEKTYTKALIKFSFWNMVGDLGHLVRTQGISIIVNLLYGPTANAALGIANQVSMQTSQLTNTLSGASSPEIYKRVGQGRMTDANRLAYYTTRIGIALMLMLSVPVMFNIDYILQLWLENIPEGTNVLCICFIIMFLVEKIVLGHYVMLIAINKISAVQTVILLSYTMAVVFPFLGFNYFGLLGIGLSCILSMLLSRGAILYYVKKYLFISLGEYSKSIIIPYGISLLLVCCCYYGYSFVNIHSLLELIGMCSILFLFTGIISYRLIFSRNDRNWILSSIQHRFFTHRRL